jgi:RNA polymerase sigma factor (sigma-70 family)
MVPIRIRRAQQPAFLGIGHGKFLRFSSVGGSFFHDMSEPRTDFELLAAFGREGDEGAFRQLVRRHLDLVYATALRKVTDPGAAEEIAQNVFHALARKATRFASDTALPAWLHRTALLESRHWLRGELRRRRREETAAQLGTTMTAPDEVPAWRELVPLLDDALLSLREKDRTALLLRFHENKPLKEVGQSMGVGEDAAQKRVQTALERVAKFFRRHGHRAATGAIAATALQGTAQAAPAALLATTIQSTLAVAPATVLSGLSLWLARLASLSKAKTAVACVAIVAVPAVFEWRGNSAIEKHLSEISSQASALRLQESARSESHAALQAEEWRRAAELAREEAALIRRQSSVSKTETFKSRLLAYLHSDEPAWPADLPFVRIPKNALGSIKFRAWDAQDQLTDEAKGMLALSSEEAAQIDTLEGAFRDAVAQMMVLSAKESPETGWINTRLPIELPTDFRPDAPRLVLLMDASDLARAELKARFFREQTELLGPDRPQLLARQAKDPSPDNPWLSLQKAFMGDNVELAVGASPLSKRPFVLATKETVFSDGKPSGAVGRYWWNQSVVQSFPPSISALFVPWLKEHGIELEESK